MATRLLARMAMATSRPSWAAAGDVARRRNRWPPAQRDISVSEFFAKNRHLLGLRQSAQGAADHRQGGGRQLARRLRRGRHPARDLGSHRADRQRPLQGRRAGQRAGHCQEADSADLRQAALRLEVSSPAEEPRPAGHRHLRGRHVRRADDRQAGEDHLEGRARRSRPTTTKFRSTPRRTSRRFSTAAAKASTFRPATKGAAAIEKHGIEWVEQPHGTRVTIELEAKYVRGRGSVDEYLAANGDRQSARCAALPRSRRRRTRLRAVGRMCCRRSRKRSSRIRTASSWAGW